MQPVISLRSSLRAVIKTIGQAPRRSADSGSLSTIYRGLHQGACRFQHIEAQGNGAAAAATIDTQISRSAAEEAIDSRKFGQELGASKHEEDHWKESRVGITHRSSDVTRSHGSSTYSSSSRRLRETKEQCLSGKVQNRRTRQQQEHVRLPSSIKRLLTEDEFANADLYIPRKETVCVLQGQTASIRDDWNEVVLEVMLRTGCHIRITPQASTNVTPSEDVTGSTLIHLTLWGLALQNAHAAQLLASFITASSVSDPAVGSGPRAMRPALTSTVINASFSKNADQRDGSVEEPRRGVVRVTWSNRPMQPETVTDVLKQRPEKWNTIKFAEYVQRLTARRSWSLRRNTSASNVSDRTSTDQVVAELLALFLEDPHSAAYFSEESVNKTLQYLLHHSRMGEMKRVLISLESSTIYSMTASNYDVFLNSAATSGDMHNFDLFLKSMLDRELKPTWQTWVAVHRLALKLQSPRVIQQIFKAMERKGVLRNLQASKAVAADAVRPALRRHLRKQGNLDSFFAYFDRKFAFDVPKQSETNSQASEFHHWMSNEATTFMVEELLALGRLSDALTIVSQYVVQRSGTHLGTLRSILIGALRAKDMDSAVSAVNEFRVGDKSPGVPAMLDARSLDILFKLAWRTESFNVLRVIWRYACLGARLRWRDHLVARQSMTLYPLPEEVETRLIQARHLDDIEFPSASNEITRELDAILGTSDASDPDSTPTRAQNMISVPELFKRWAAKFIVNIEDSLPAGSAICDQKMSPTGDCMLRTATSRRFLESAEHQRRKQDGLAMLHQDTLTWQKYVPRTPFYLKLAEAWRKDQVWARELFSNEAFLADLAWTELEDLTAEQRIERIFGSLQSLFTKMLAKGIKVPIRKKRVDSHAR